MKKLLFLFLFTPALAFTMEIPCEYTEHGCGELILEECEPHCRLEPCDIPDYVDVDGKVTVCHIEDMTTLIINEGAVITRVCKYEDTIGSCEETYLNEK